MIERKTRRWLPWPALTIGKKIGACFGVMALAMTAACGLVLHSLDRVRTDSGKLLEENREHALTEDVVTTLEHVETFFRAEATLPPAEREVFRQEAFGMIDRVGAVIRELAGGPAGPDPSTAAHQRAEDRVIVRITTEFDALRAKLQDGDRLLARDEVLAAVVAARVLATQLETETREEAARASRDLERRVRHITTIVISTTVATVAVLLGVFAFVMGRIVAPVKLLRAGTERFGRGELRHRIEATASDEVGDLARAFNDMAERIDRSHADLQSRVEEGTRQFIQTARLADLGTLAAGVAHEINNPLASIASCAEGLERRIRTHDVDEAEQLEYLQTIAREAYRAHDTTARLLAFARQDARPVSPTPVAELIRQVELMVRHQMDRSGLRLLVEIEGEPPAIEGNSAELMQVLFNLLHNARDASPKGGTVWLRCRADREHVVLEVEDQGPGVAPADRQRIFDPFFTTKAPGQGTGLGLSIAHRVVEGHGGRISVADAPGGGALFRVRLPLAQAARA